MFTQTKGFLLALVTAAACVACTTHTSSSVSAQPPEGTTTRDMPATIVRTHKIVDAADAFLTTLTDDQKKRVLFAFTDSAQRTRWSNFPDGTVNRAGLRWGKMSDTQRAALMNLLGAVLSPQGVKMVKEQMEAEEVLKNTPPTATRGANFGMDYFFVSFVGTPSANSPWMLQFGRHHLALNATIVGPNLTISPTLSGGEPLKYIAKDGKPVYVVSDEATKSMTLLNSLNAEQRKKAIIGPKMINLVLGPGHDGQTLQPEGVPGSELTEVQKAQLLGVIQARLGIMNAEAAAVTMATIRKNLAATYFAWYGPTTELGTAYFRVTGPTVLTEFAPQRADARFSDITQHAHNMYRDPTNEYGSAWTSLR